MLDDMTFNKILRDRYVPEMPSNLAYRIIEAAKPRGDERGLTLAGIGRAFAELLAIPQPAFALAAMLFLGVMAGAYYTSETATTMAMARDNFSSVVTAELSVDYGDFL